MSYSNPSAENGGRDGRRGGPGGREGRGGPDGRGGPGGRGGRGGGPGGRGGGGRRRQPPVLVEVDSVTPLSPRMVSVKVSGAPAERFGAAAPTSHVKVFLPAPGQDAPTMPSIGPDGERAWPEDQPRPLSRNYTPRAYDHVAGTLEIQFVLHGHGPASEWARSAKAGDKLALGGPGGRFGADAETPRWWIAGDESAIPAIGTLLDALPASASAEVHIEVDGPGDEIVLASPANTEITWHHRREPGAWGEALYGAAASAQISDDVQVWVGCEAIAVRRIRRHFLDARGSSEALITRGYWRAGEENHPDHDFGED